MGRKWFVILWHGSQVTAVLVISENSCVFLYALYIKTVSGQWQDSVGIVSGHCLECVWKVFETEVFGHTFFAKLSPPRLRLTLFPLDPPPG